MDEIEAAGTMLTGAALARAVEPGAGEADDGHTHESACLNCRTPLTGPYCHACGQQAHVHRTLSAFFHDLLHGALHFEGKTWRTIPLLAWRPGELTRRYIDGQRARFVSPIALFLFSVFLLFAVGSLTGGLSPVVNQPEMRRELAQDIAKNEVRVAVMQKQRDAALKAGRPVADLDEKLADARSEITVMKGLSTGDFVPARTSVQSDDLPGWLRRPIEQVGRNPELTYYKIKTNAYKFSWLIIPLSVPFLWLLFPFSRRFRLYDHTVFVTYSLCFMTLLLVVAMLLGTIGLGGLGGALALLVPVHMYRQLKGAYALGRFGALWRTMLLTIFALAVIVIFALLLFGVGLFN